MKYELTKYILFCLRGLYISTIYNLSGEKCMVYPQYVNSNFYVHFHEFNLEKGGIDQNARTA